MSSHAKDPPSSNDNDAKSNVPNLVDIDDRLALDDFSGALTLTLQRQETDADDDTIRVIRRYEQTLRKMYVGKLGGFSRQIKVIMTANKMRQLALDHQTDFLISHIVDPTTIEDLLDIYNIPELQTLKVLYNLKSQEVIELVDGE